MRAPGTGKASNCRQRDIDNAADYQKLILTLQHPGQQAALEEDLGQRNVDFKYVVAELAGAFAAAGE